MTPSSARGRLADRVIVVTGAARGIGRATCRAVAEAGAHVVPTDLEADSLLEAADDVESAGGRALPMAMDVTDRGEVEGTLDAVLATFGHLDGLVNNAGVIGMGRAFDTTEEAWRRHFRVNVEGLFTCCREAALRMEGGGVIVNVASNAGKVGYPNMAAYNASKAAVVNLTRTLAAEWADRHINVNAVCPGGVDTPMLGEVARWIGERVDADPDEILSGMPPPQLGRLVEPIEVGRVIAFLLSDDAKIIRGQSINADGGDTPY